MELVYKISLKGRGPFLIVESLEEVHEVLKHDLLVDAPDCDAAVVEPDEMTQEELDNLDEFTGW